MEFFGFVYLYKKEYFYSLIVYVFVEMIVLKNIQKIIYLFNKIKS